MHLFRAFMVFAVLVPVLAVGAENNAASSATKALHDLFDRDWEYQMEQNPLWASSLGDRRWNDKWSDESLGAIHARFGHSREVLKELHAIDRRQLSPQDQVSYDIFEFNQKDAIESEQYKWYLIRTNTYSGIQTAEREVDELRFETVNDYDDWLARLRSFPTYMEQNIALMREGMKQHVVLPKVVGEKVLGQLSKMDFQDPTKTHFYEPFTRMPATFSEAEKQRLTSQAQQVIKSDDLPAFKRLRDFMAGEYIAASFDQVGAWQVPNGDQTYAYLARSETTTDYPPAQIHEIGLKEVQRISAEMEKIKDKTGFKGSTKEFFNYLRTDPKFYLKTDTELMEYSRARAKEVDPLLIKLFRTFPRVPYGVVPIPAAIAPLMTTAYAQPAAPDGSRPGYFYVNTYKPETRPTYEITSLILHEAVPGHTFQLGIANDLKDLPKFRRFGGYTAYVEGWALYCESLGDELGLYDDPYVKFGALSAEMWRAVRLVVDTGMHYKHWTRQQAIDYFLANTALSELNATVEVDRYISWPGQALAYKIGQLKIRELRTKAEKDLGPAFDIREFHDVILLGGSLPLAVLEKEVDGWIAEKKGGKVAEQLH
jgi:uncharacterized protein (DUF885 family)